MNVKKLFAVALTAVMTMSVASCGGNKSDLEYIKDKGTMKIGYTVINPLNYEENGELTGFETEFATLVCEKLGVTPEFIEINWDTKEIELNSKNIDCIWNGLTITPERRETMSITTPYLENRQVLVTKAENADKYKDSLAGARVTAEAGSAGDELALEDAFFADIQYTAVASQATALMEVKSGTSDVAVIDYVMAGSSTGEGTDYSDLVIIDKGFNSEEYGVAFRKDSDITAEVNKAITSLMTDDGRLMSLADKYGLTELLIAK